MSDNRYTLIKVKRGLEENLANILLKEGEPAFSKDRKGFFVGDGKTLGGILIGRGGTSSTMKFSHIDSNSNIYSNQILCVDTSDGEVTLTLPPNAVHGDEIRIIDCAGTFNVNNCIINRNGNLLNNTAVNLTLDQIGGYVLYYGVVKGEVDIDSWFCFPANPSEWIDKSSNGDFRAVYTDTTYDSADFDLILADTESGSYTVVTPENPKIGDKIQIQDYSETFDINNLTVSSIDKIDCEDSDLTLSEKGTVATLTFGICEDGSFSWFTTYGRDYVPGGGGTGAGVESVDTLPSAHDPTMEGDVLYVKEDKSVHFADHEKFNQLISTKDIGYGVGTFSGNGSETTVAHGLSKVPTIAMVTPNSDPTGYLGEVWSRVDATNIYVGNSGSYTGQFYWFVM